MSADTTPAAIDALCERLWRKPNEHRCFDAAATLIALQSEVAVVTAERDAMRVLLERIDDAWCGLTQTHLAASSVGLRLAKAVQNEGYGLHLKIAVKEARIMLAGKAGA